MIYQIFKKDSNGLNQLLFSCSCREQALYALVEYQHKYGRQYVFLKEVNL